MKKGITPIISIIVLLLITVALAATAYTYLSSYMGTYTEKSFLALTGNNPRCINHNITIRIKNMGATDLTSADFIEKTITNSTDTYTLNVPTIKPKEIGILHYKNDALSGSYTITLTTSAGTQTFSVVC